MRTFIAFILLACILMGCSSSSQVDREATLAVERGKVTNWRSPPLHQLDLAISICEQPEFEQRNALQCAARRDELAVIAEAKSDCSGVTLPSCRIVRQLIAAGPPALEKRMARHEVDDEVVEFDWLHAPRNIFLRAHFGVDDRFELFLSSVRKNAFVLSMTVLLLVVAVWLSIKYRLWLEKVERCRLDREAELAIIRLEEKHLEREAAKSRERTRELELQAAQRMLALEKYRDQREREQWEAKKRQHLSEERQRILRAFGDIA